MTGEKILVCSSISILPIGVQNIEEYLAVLHKAILKQIDFIDQLFQLTYEGCFESIGPKVTSKSYAFLKYDISYSWLSPHRQHGIFIIGCNAQSGDKYWELFILYDHYYFEWSTTAENVIKWNRVWLAVHAFGDQIIETLCMYWKDKQNLHSFF